LLALLLQMLYTVRSERTLKPGRATKVFNVRISRRHSPDDPCNPTVNFHGENRSNDTQSPPLTPTRGWRKSGAHEAKLAYCGNVMTENRNGSGGGQRTALAQRTVERDAATMMAERVE